MSNTERQRKFRAANPAYFNKYNNRRKAIRIAAQKKVLALMQELAKARVAATQAQAATPLVLLPKMPLMLPAPVQDPAMAALDSLAASLKSKSAVTTREPLPVSNQSRAA